MIEKESDLWQTPKDLYDDLNREFKFDYDVCQNGTNGLAPYLGDYFTSNYSHCVCFMNPPYSNPTKFVNRAIELTKDGVVTVCLLKCDTSTKLFHDVFLSKYEVRFLKGRLKFTHPNKQTIHRANFPSMIVVIRG